MATLTEQLTRTYNSFSGVDIQATFGSKVIGTLQGVSYTVTREKAPIYTMGSANPRAFSRGNLLPRNCAQNGESYVPSEGYANPVAKLQIGDAVQTYA